MYFHDVIRRREERQIRDVVVVRSRLPGAPRPTRSEMERESKSRYWLIFIPGKDLPYVPKAEHFFLNLDRAGFREHMRYFRSLFTVQQNLKKWGFSRFHFIDLALCTHEQAVESIVAVMKGTKGPYSPVKQFLEEFDVAETKTRR